MDELTRIFDGFGAEMSSRLGKQVRRGMLARAKRGLPIGMVPTGYRKWGRKIRTVEPTATHIANAFRRIDLDGVSVRTAWRLAIADGMLGRGGRSVSVSAFQLIIKNPFYAGLVKFGDELYQGTHEPLVSEEVFRRVQSKIGARPAARILPATDISGAVFD